MKNARVIEEHKTNYVIFDGVSEITASVRGSFFAKDDFPVAVGPDIKIILFVIRVLIS